MIMSVHELPREAPVEMSTNEKLQMYHDQGYFPSMSFLKGGTTVDNAVNSTCTTEMSESTAIQIFDKERFLKSDFLTQANDIIDIPVEQGLI